MGFWNNKRSRRAMLNLPITLNGFLIVFGLFILFAMAIVWIVFEEFTAFTDNTQQWIEFNFFIFYWDKLTISRVYLSFITIYGGVLVGSRTCFDCNNFDWILLFNKKIYKSFSWSHANPWNTNEKSKLLALSATSSRSSCAHNCIRRYIVAYSNSCQLQWRLFSHGWFHIWANEI